MDAEFRPRAKQTLGVNLSRKYHTGIDIVCQEGELGCTNNALAYFAISARNVKKKS